MHTLKKEFRHIDPSQARIFLIEGMPHILGAYSEYLSGRAKLQLEELGVQVITNTYVQDIKEGAVILKDKTILASTIMWAAGVKASPLVQTLGVDLDKAGRVPVNDDLTIPGYDNAFVVGDLAAIKDNGEWVPGVAPAAIQQGNRCGNNIKRRLKGLKYRRFHYEDKGSMATIGRAAAVARIGKWEFSGLVAWLLWLFVHIMYLIGFKNRVFVLFQWAWHFITFKRGSRLITNMFKKSS